MSSENRSATPSLSSIESAIKLIDVKKDELKRAFDDLQANSQRLSSFSISWSDLDSHFTALQNSVTQRFRILLSREAIHNPIDHVPTQPLASKQGDPSAPHPLTEQDPVDSVVNQPLTHLLPLDSDKPSSSNSLSVQSDGSVPPSGNIDSVVTRPELKKFCERMDGKGLRKYINDHVKEREAIRMELPCALQSATDPGAMVLDAMEGFYAENSQSKDLIQKLLDSGKQLLAVRFIFEFGLAEKFSPVPLLEEYLNETKKLAQQVCQNGKNTLKSQNEATSKEIGALKSVIKIIEEHKLETQYSREPLQKRIEQLEKQLANRKPPATPAAPKPQQLQASQPVAQQAKKKKKQAQGKQQQSANKHPKTTASVVHAAPLLSAAGSTSAVAPFQPPGLLLDHSAAYLSSSPIPFGFPGPTAVNPYAGPSAAMYGLAGAPMGFPVNPNSSASHLYNYDRLPTYGAYGFPPQFHPSYHPK
ncbi:hypothetical protein ERO13_A13G134700v2 [Gossypium hirsutum]|nr:hypothetical protein ERO13_A13G134700v2 [Gossypium hirsutum]